MTAVDSPWRQRRHRLALSETDIHLGSHPCLLSTDPGSPRRRSAGRKSISMVPRYISSAPRRGLCAIHRPRQSGHHKRQNNDRDAE
jgi:hypothetical protein